MKYEVAEKNLMEFQLWGKEEEEGDLKSDYEQLVIKA